MLPMRVARTSPGGYLSNWFETNVYLESTFHKANFPLLIVNIPFTYKGTADVDTNTPSAGAAIRLEPEMNFGRLCCKTA